MVVGVRDFEKESLQARRQSAPALEMVRVAEATAEAAEQQVSAAREVAASANQQLSAATNALRSPAVHSSCVFLSVFYCVYLSIICLSGVILIFQVSS